VTRELPRVDGVEHRFVSAGGLRTHVAEAGDPDAPPLLLVHGWPQNWFAWHELIGPLAADHRIIAPDLRGFGWTDAPPGGYDPEVFAMDIAALLDALEIDKPVDYMGHDWGGWTGFMLALRRPERVRRLLALGIIHPFARPNLRAVLGGWRFWYQWLLATPGLGTATLRQTIRRNPVLLYLGANQDVWGPEELRIYAEQFEEPDRAAATRLLYRHAAVRLQLQIREYRGMRMETPTLLLFPKDDAVQKRIPLGGYEDNAPNMEIEVVPDTSHFIVDERTELVLDRARAFFRS
jgi:pimeloyl-ACP methyl ester carboxylesterase